MKNLLFIYLLISTFCISILNAQNLDKGVISYKVVDFEMGGAMFDNMDAEQAKQVKATMAPMMQNFTQTIAWDGQNQVGETKMGGMSATKVFTDMAKKQSISYSDIMGQKYKIVSPIPEDNKNETTADIKEFKNDTKTIAGYDCYKVVYHVDLSKTMENVKGDKNANLTKDTQFEAYITEKIKPSSYISASQGVKLKGMPLEMSFNMQGMKMKLEAYEVKNTVDKSFFIEPTGYKEISLEDFQKKTGKMRK